MTTSTRPVVRALRATGSLLLLGALLGLVVAGVHGVRFLPVLTGSMTPYAPAGSLVLTLPVAGEDLAVGDVVAFRPPAPYTVAGDRPILHRVATLGVQDDQAFMTTKGDANPSADPWRVGTQNATFGRALVVVPHLGRLFAGGTEAALAVVLGAAALVAGAGALRRGRSPARHRVPGRGGRRTVHRDPARSTVTIAVDVPRERWDAADGPQLVEASARRALDRGAGSLGLVLAGSPAQKVEHVAAGGLRLTLIAPAVAA